MKNLLLLCAIMLYLPALAQTKLKGSVNDAVTNLPLPFATISIADTLQKKDTVFTETNENGNFEVTVPIGCIAIRLIVKYVGYAPYERIITTDKTAESIMISLQPESSLLEEVTLNSRRNAVTINGDKIIYNVDKLAVGDGNNGLETMQLIPGVKLDKDDNIQFRGSTGVQILINGRKSLLQGDALREYIRSLKGSDIQSIEVIAQPSARYDATGTTGIINIVLKKNRSAGITGNGYSYSSDGEFFKSQNGAQLFYSDSLWNINGNGYYYDGNSVNHRRVKQTIQLEDGVKIIDQHNEWLPRTLTKNLNFGVERKLTKHSLISTEWQYNTSNEDENTYGTTNEYLNGIQDNTVNLTQSIASPSKRVTGNLFYNFTADSTRTKLDVQANYAYYKSSHDGFQRNDYANGSFMQLDGNRNTVYNIVTGQADLYHELTKKMNLEAGVKYSYVKMDYLNAYTSNGTGAVFIPDSLLINDFKYKEHLASAYAQYSVNLEKWNFMAGLRAEYYNYEASSGINHKVNSAKYTNWFPSASVSYKHNYHQYQAAYSRRIGRPSYLSLNPYYQYIDAYTLEKGNPALQPEFYHSFQLSYVYKSALNVSIYGYLYNKGFTTVIDYQESQNYNITYEANAAKGNRFGISASMPYEPFDWWTMQLSLDGSYRFEKSYIPNFNYNGSGYGYDISLYENFKLKNDWAFNWNGFYSGRSTTPNGYSRATYDFSITAKKLMFEKKLQLSFGCSNILKKSFYNHVTEVGNVSTDWTNRWETRRFYLQVLYNFGGAKTKKVRSASLGDETNRM